MEIISTPAGTRTAYGWASGDEPGAVVFSHGVPTAIQDAIVPALESCLPGFSKPCELRALAEVEHIVGRYHALCPSGEFFVRVSSIEGHPELERRLVEHLRLDGVSVNDFLAAGERVTYGGRSFRLDVRPFLHGDHNCDSQERLAALATIVRNSHASLENFPLSQDVKANAVKRLSELRNATRDLAPLLKTGQWKEISPDPGWSHENADFLAEMVESFQTDFPSQAGAQCLHGQIHRANVLFALPHGHPVLLDFEESVHVYATPAWDTAHLVQRFCLHDDPEPAVAARRLAVVSGVFGKMDREVFEMMRQIAWFSIAILTLAWRRRRLHAPRQEYEKFVRMERQAVRFQNLLIP